MNAAPFKLDIRNIFCEIRQLNRNLQNNENLRDVYSQKLFIMVKCAVSGCPNYEGKKNVAVRFFRFPKDSIAEKTWINACGKNTVFNAKAARMCSEHFTEEDWQLKHILLDIPGKKKRLRQEAVPTRNLPHVIKRSAREKRYKNKERKQLIEEILSTYEKSQQAYISELPDTPELTDIIIDTTQNNENFQVEATCTVGVQTEFDPNCSREIEMCVLRAENVNLKYEIRNLIKSLGAAQSTNKSINKIFTKGQIKRLKNPERRSKWTREDFSSAISLYNAGPRAYRVLCKRNYPLPPAIALQRWTSKLELPPGVLRNILHLLSNCDYDQNERLCVLSLDKIEIRTCLNYDMKTDKNLMSSKYAQVVMVRGLFQKWKHIIYYDFDCSITVAILMDIVRNLRNINFKVVAVVSDMGPGRLILWKELQITEEKPYFELEDDKMFFFVDVPDILKLIRYHFLEAGFILNGTNIDVSPLKELLNSDKADLELCHKLTEAHIIIKRASRQKVKFAAQIFSNSVSEDLRKCASLGKMKSENALECCDFIKLVNDWFDVFNSKSQTEVNSKGAMAYGQALEDQNNILCSMTDSIKNLRVKGMETLRPFQKGIVLNNSSLPKLYEFLREKYYVSCIITNRLNQDELKKFLGTINSKSDFDCYPTALEFKKRLRSAILSNLIK